MDLIHRLEQGSDANKVAELAQLRELIWQTQRTLNLAQQEAKAEQAKVDALHIKQRNLNDNLRYMDKESKLLVDYKGLYEKMELVDLEEFKAANPSVNVDELAAFELASARLDDEERRRTELFGEKLELEAERTRLEKHVQQLEARLETDGPLGDDVRRAVASFKKLETYF